MEIRSSVEHAIQIDDINGNRLWQEALDKEMLNGSVAFEILRTGVPVPVGWKKSYGNLIWDVNMDFTQKACSVKVGHCKPDPKESNYAIVVSRVSVRIALTYADLNDVDLTASDIQNTYLQAPSYEKHYVFLWEIVWPRKRGKDGSDQARALCWKSWLAGTSVLT